MNKIKIPKCFNILNHKYIVETDKTLIDKDDAYGKAIFREHKILIADKVKHNIKETEIERTFLHELLHVIFYEIGEKEICNNEKIIELAAATLAQALSTMEYNNLIKKNLDKNK